VDQVVVELVPLKFLPTQYMERCFVKLKPKSEWVSADSKDELADKIKAAIENRFQIWKLNLHNLSKCVSTN
jgi:hypothetical protein